MQATPWGTTSYEGGAGAAGGSGAERGKQSRGRAGRAFGVNHITQQEILSLSFLLSSIASSSSPIPGSLSLTFGTEMGGRKVGD